MKKKISIIFGLFIAIMCSTACSALNNEDAEMVSETDRIELADVDKDKEEVFKNSLGDEENNNFYNSVVTKVDDDYIMVHTMIPLELEEEVPTEVLEIVDGLCESLVEYISRVEISYDEPVIRIVQE